jgi:hypothetical protein
MKIPLVFGQRCLQPALSSGSLPSDGAAPGALLRRKALAFMNRLLPWFAQS